VIAKPVIGVAAGASAWEQRVGAFTALPALIRGLGTEPHALLASVGLAADALDAPDNRVPYGRLCKLLSSAAEHTQCGHLGLLAGRLWHLSDLGLLGELVRNAATTGDALQTLIVYQHLNSEGGLPFMTTRGNAVDVGYAIYYPGADGTAQMYEACLASGMNFMREICGTGWRPAEVLIAHSPPADATPYNSFFKSRTRFNAEYCALRFPTHWLERPIEGADPARLRLLTVQANASGGPDFVQSLYRALRTFLINGGSSADDVATMLSLHRRTLNRRLKAQGMTFQHVLDQVRLEVARQLLSNTDLTLDDIAAALGYGGVTQFMRTFHRWTGQTPGRWRRVARQSGRQQ